jgi:hypothetical protein
MIYKKTGFIATLITLFFIMSGANRLIAQPGTKHGITVAVGSYAAEGLGTNLYFEARYNHFLSSGKYFFEAGLGIGSIESQLLKTISNSQLFESNNLLTYQFLLGYDHVRLSGIPYLVGGFTGIDQGGQTRFAFVVGLGKRFSLWESSSFRFRYDIRAHIFKQEFNDNSSFTALNMLFTLGGEYYF